MLMINKTNNNCGNGDAFVAYLYGELPANDRERFEDHLLDCTACTDEFASVADSRYSVYEWRKLDFDPLETPVFQIPYAEAKASIGWFEAFKGIFAAGPRLATAGAFAVLIAVAGIAFINGGFGSNELAKIENVPAVVDNSLPSAPIRTEPDTVSPNVDTAEAIVPLPKSPDVARSEERTIPRRKAVSTKRQGTAVAVRNVQQAPNSVPRLNDFDDVTDTSLRLSDLVADIGSLDD